MVMNMARGERKNHKYLYKKNVNGKTRYFYDVGKANWKNGNSNIGEDGMETDSNIRGYTKVQDILGYDERDRRNRAVARYENANDTFENQKEMSYDDLENTNKEVIKEGKRSLAAIKAYNKTPLGKIEKVSTSLKIGSEILKKKIKDIL